MYLLIKYEGVVSIFNENIHKTNFLGIFLGFTLLLNLILFDHESFNQKRILLFCAISSLF